MKQNNLKILSIIPARGGSKGVTKKNIRLMAGKPLIFYSIEAGLKSEYIDRVVVTTENIEISKIAERYGAEVIKRPEKLAKDDTPSPPVYKHAIRFLEKNKQYKPDIIVVLQPPTPLRTVEDIDSCIRKLIKEKCDSVITLRKVEHPVHWMVKIDKNGKVYKYFELNEIKRRQDAADVYMPNGAVFVTWYDIFMKYCTMRGPDTRAIIMPQERSIDIDTELDFFIAEKLMDKKKVKFNSKKTS